MMTANEIKAILKLEPHPIEGGSFRRTYTSAGTVDLPRGTRHQGTAIYYLLEPGTFSEMHVLDSDEIFHFYLGDPVEMLQLAPNRTAQTFVIGNDLARGQHPQLLVPKNVWQGSRLLPGGKVALLGCTVSPGFDYADYESGARSELLREYPQSAELIHALTRA